MFGSSSPFGQQTSSPFGAQQPAFGQTNNATSNPFSPRPFGSTSPFGAQTGASMFGGNVTGVFGAPQTPSATPAFGSSTPSFGTTAFGSTSTTAFGSTTTPAFGGSSSPAFGSTTSPPFGTSTFGQKPAFGGFGAPNSAQSSPFGGTIGQTQSTFGATSQPAFGSTSPFGQSTPLFGSTTTPAFGTTSGTPAFGTSGTPAFGTTGSSFSFGGPGNFGQSSSSPAFGSSSSSPAFGTPTSPFGSTSQGFGTQPTTPSFGNTAFGGQRGGSRVVPYTSTIEQDIPAGQTPGKLTSVSAIPQYKDKSHEELRWEDYQLGDKGGPNPAGQQPAAANAFQQSPQSGMFGQTPSSFGQSPTFGQTSTANPFSSSSTSLFGGKPTVFGGAPSGSTFGSPFGTASSSPFGASSAAPSTFGSSTSTFGTTVSSPFGASTSSPTFGSTTFGQSSQSGSLFGSSPSLGSSPFGSSTSFGATQSSGPFQSSSPSFGPTISPFGQQQSTPAFGTTVFGQTPPGLGQTTSTFGQTFGQPTSTVAPAAGPFGQPSPVVTGQTSSPFGSTPLFGQQPTTPNFGQANSGFGQTNSGFGQTNPSFVQTTPSFGNLFSGNTSSFMSQSKPAGLTQSSQPSLFGGFQASAPTQASAPIQASSSFSFSGFGQSQGNLSSGFGGTATPSGQNTFTQSTQQSIMPAAPQPVDNPFGTLPAMPQMSIGRNPGSTPALQYGISSMPVNDQPVQSRMSMLTPRHVLTSSKLRMHSRRYNPKKDGTKVSFLSDMEEAPTTPRADAMFIPRENPRALFIQPQEESSAFKPATKVKEIATPITENGNAGGDKHGGSSLDKSFRQEAEGVVEDSVSQKHQKPSQRQNNVEEYNHRGNGYRSLSGHRAGEAAIVYEHGADIEALMPKLRHSDYYTEPKIQELAAKERAERGYCCRVKDFIVGRKGYGYVKFLGETDVRRLDLENIIQFNKCEILVYMDEGKKPPPGQGLNKPAEITLLNVKSVDKKTGQHHPEGPEVEKFRRKLRKKTEDQGAELISYDSIKGEWRFRVKHFCRYYLDESFFEDMLC